MKKFQCYKQVEAFEIGKIEGCNLYLKGNDETFITVSADYISRHPLNQPGYYVRYADGYESFSPKEAFESGYSEIGPAYNSILSDEDAERLLSQLTGERVTKEFIQSRIAAVAYLVVPETTVTICHIEIDNGFSVRGESACVDPKNFNQELGEKYAYENAFEKLWAFFGFLLAEKRKLPFDKTSHDWAGHLTEYLIDNNLASFTKADDIASAISLTLRNFRALITDELQPVKS